MKLYDYMSNVCDEVAVSLRKSIDVYWPVSDHPATDLPERNLSTHFSHIMISKGFHVFAEAKHPAGNKRIDILCISPDKSFSIACEFKQYEGLSLGKSIDDLARVNTFTLNQMLKLERIGTDRAATLKTCRTNFGFVAGLGWSGNINLPRNHPLPNGKGHSEFSAQLQKLGGRIGDLKLARISQAKNSSGAYYILWAMTGGADLHDF